jgi:bifunctional non-homologous end joining protein LigD
MSYRIPFTAHPMLATLVAQPFERKGWVFEEKYDGDRVLAYKEGARVRLESRNGKDRTDRFPQLAAAIRKLPARTLLLDGEVVIFDEHGASRFQLLQEGHGKARYAVFDCLYCNGKDLRREKLSARRAVMERSIGSSVWLLASRRLAEGGIAAFRLAKRSGYEGLVAKDLSSPYEEGRSKKWLKVKVHQEDEFVICGYTKPAGTRQHLGALLLGAYGPDKHLRYVGKVGTGFDEATLASLYKQLRPLVKANPVLADRPRDKGLVFVTPRLVAQISYQELTREGRLRQPVFLGLRDDKQARDVRLPKPLR